MHPASSVCIKIWKESPVPIAIRSVGSVKKRALGFEHSLNHVDKIFDQEQFYGFLEGLKTGQW